jgi:hypothetical protein
MKKFLFSISPLFDGLPGNLRSINSLFSILPQATVLPNCFYHFITLVPFFQLPKMFFPKLLWIVSWKLSDFHSLPDSLTSK